MGKPTGFLEENRELPKKRDVNLRVKDYNEVDGKHDEKITHKQASRCMDCGTPFCHQGCPLGNIIPEFNDAVYQHNWKLAYEILISTNNFPEFTGRICPAPCEASCVLGINKPPVAIEYIEKSIIEKAFENGYVKPRIPSVRTQKKIAIVGSGPAGLAAACQLNYAGHTVTVFERADEIGGLLRYGIPDFKLDKQIVNRRIELMTQEGILFHTNTTIGKSLSWNYIDENFDAILLCTGSTVPRDLPLPGRTLKGVHVAMDFLVQQNKRIGDQYISESEILASGKNVVVIGGGDTGSDCVGTAIRHKATSVTQLEILPKPPTERTSSMPWPNWPLILRTSTSHEEGCKREWNVITKEFIGDEHGNLKGIKIATVEMSPQQAGKAPNFQELEGSDKIIPCELALLAMGFLHTEHQGLVEQLGLDLDERGNIKCQRFKTSKSKIFAAGDARRGQSLVVWAMSEGREAARAVDEFLMDHSVLESKDKGVLNLFA
jgi:glutamate synthase (NADPH) small chain